MGTLFYWPKRLTDEGGRKPENPEKTPAGTSFKTCHILKLENSNRKRDSNPRWWQARKADVLSITPGVAPSYQAPGVLDTVLGLVGPVSVYFEQVRQESL